ncbi:SoxR reducing system RseC family protein [Ectopseudomonas khazarica]|uniref:Positive regulator for alginate biosynthesis MucC n=1 Tax=Ectopseudomonas oleovorans TaxID=301 RepID=A0A653B8U3_ECTOL|nr:Sigma factor RpoE regulatory protein RseC [Pseudomonas oleovorans]
MIEEQGRVVALEPGAVWVETLRRSTCSSCSANAACGQGVMERLGVGRERGHVRALSTLHLNVGDAVVIGVREELLVRSSLLVYLLPLLGLMAAALAADAAGLSEPLCILSGLAGLSVSWLLVRWRASRVADDPQLQPVVLRALLAASP